MLEGDKIYNLRTHFASQQNTIHRRCPSVTLRSRTILP